MAKKHRDRPALNAARVFHWIINGILEIEPIKGTPAFIITRGKNVRQRWLRCHESSRIISMDPTIEIVSSFTAATYLRTGIILVPRWYRVPDWRVKYLQEKGIADRLHGFATFEGRLYELRYQQLEDLDHCRRQQKHILEGYEMPGGRLTAEDFQIMMDRLERTAAITRRIAGRKAGFDSLYTIIQGRLAPLRRSLVSFVANAPTLKGTGEPNDQQTLVSALKKMAEECLGFACRPLVLRTRRASRSISLAIEHIEAGRMELARERLLSALKNLEYPKPTQTPTPRSAPS